MKTFMLNLALLGSTTLLLAQTAPVDKFFTKYEDHTLSLDFTIPTWIKNEINFDNEDPHLERAIKKASKIKLLIVDKSTEWQRDVRSLSKELPRQRYESLIEVRNSDQLINMYLSEGRDDQDMKELLVLLDGDGDKGILFSLKGTFTKEDVKHILDDVEIH